MLLSVAINPEIKRRIALECDAVATPHHDTIEFHFDTTEKFNAVINGASGIRDAIARAYMLGFTRYVFRDLQAEKCYPSDKDFWIRRDRQSSGRSRWGAR
jgi:hypothetical protein